MTVPAVPMQQSFTKTEDWAATDPSTAAKDWSGTTAAAAPNAGEWGSSTNKDWN